MRGVWRYNQHNYTFFTCQINCCRTYLCIHVVQRHEHRSPFAATRMVNDLGPRFGAAIDLKLQHYSIIISIIIIKELSHIHTVIISKIPASLRQLVLQKIEFFLISFNKYLLTTVSHNHYCC